MTKDFQLRPFQEEVLRHVMRGRSVILQAPHRCGKNKGCIDAFPAKSGSTG